MKWGMRWKGNFCFQGSKAKSLHLNLFHVFFKWQRWNRGFLCDSNLVACCAMRYLLLLNPFSSSPFWPCGLLMPLILWGVWSLRETFELLRVHKKKKQKTKVQAPADLGKKGQNMHSAKRKERREQRLLRKLTSWPLLWQSVSICQPKCEKQLVR